jgi:transcriptional regulator with XRE-family HTH domain
MGELDESFPARLRTELTERGMSQADLARCTDIRPSTLSKIINGKQRPSGRQLAAIALELEIDLREHIGSELRDQLRAERMRVEQLAAKCAQLEQRADESEKARATEAEAKRRAETDDAVKYAQLEQRAEQAERGWAAETEARRKADAAATARCAELEQQAKQAEARCAQLEQAERERAAAEREAKRKVEADAAQAERDQAAKANRTGPESSTRTRPFNLDLSDSFIIDDPYEQARAQSDAVGGFLGKLFGAGASLLLFRRASRRIEADGRPHGTDRVVWIEEPLAGPAEDW